MKVHRLIAGALVLVGAAFLISLPTSADETKPEKSSVQQGAPAQTDVNAADTDRGPSAPEPKLAFDGPGDPKGPDTGPPGGRPPRPGDAAGPRGPRFDDDGGPGPRSGGPDSGPGGPGRDGDGPGRKFGGPGHGPGGPGGDNGPPTGRGAGPGGTGFGGPPWIDSEMAELMKQDRELGNHAEDLAAQYRRASQDEKEKLMKQVVETVNKHFDVRQQRRKLMLDRMQKELERLRGEIEHRNSQRETLSKDRVKELIGDGGPGF